MTMRRIPPIEVSRSAAAEIARRHGIHAVDLQPLPSTGIINSVYTLGDEYVLRVPHYHRLRVAQAIREAAAIPLAIEAGVRTPRLIAFDDSLEVLPVPFLIVERVHGVDVETLGPAAVQHRDAWRDVGRNLAVCR
jgi:hygromycin-B 7''-O-kinase